MNKETNYTRDPTVSQNQVNITNSCTHTHSCWFNSKSTLSGLVKTKSNLGGFSAAVLSAPYFHFPVHKRKLNLSLRVNRNVDQKGKGWWTDICCSSCCLLRFTLLHILVVCLKVLPTWLLLYIFYSKLKGKQQRGMRQVCRIYIVWQKTQHRNIQVKN